MPEVFADTSGWASLFVRSEPSHAAATALIRRWQADGTRVITSNYVVLELVSLLTSPFRIPRADQITIIETIKTVAWVEVVHVDSALDAQAWALLKARQDKTWSLVDCTSFAFMHLRGIQDALTTDHHFEQAGFSRLLK